MEFSKLSYRKQVQALTKLAQIAVRKYPMTAKQIKFINHGENATFCITNSKGNKFLLRICRNDYHTESALHEELLWLRDLGETKKFQVPVPVASKEKFILETVSSKELPNGRRVALFHWTDGRFLKKTISEKQMQEVGYWMALMHEQVRGVQVKSRRYWDAEGLVGKKAKFGSIESLPDVTKAQQKIISQARKDVHKKLKNFEKRYPEKMGLIHADMHTGNFLFNKSGLVAIDFDDCGFGFFGYDIAIPLMSLNRFKKLTPKRKTILKKAFFEGYKKVRAWDKADEEILPEFIKARRLLMLGWLNSRSDNPELKKYFKKALTDLIKDLR